jgi:DNA modification methylase
VTVRILNGDCRDVLRELPAESVHCVVTSPPYWGLRDYGVAGQIGLETSPNAFVDELVSVFNELRRVLRDDGTAWLNLGDSYASNGAESWGSSDKSTLTTGSRNGAWAPGKTVGTTPARSIGDLKPKDLCGIPWRVAFALQADGWYLRQDIIWSKPNPMPESVRDRCTKSHEYLFLLSKSERYHYDANAIAEPGTGRETFFPATPQLKALSATGARNDGNSVNLDPALTRNKRSVWEVTTQPFSEAHFATFPPALIEPCILAGCPKGGTVLDPFGGAGTTGLVADRLGRNAILIELNPAYATMAEYRIRDDAGMFAEVTA